MSWQDLVVGKVSKTKEKTDTLYSRGFNVGDRPRGNSQGVH